VAQDLAEGVGIAAAGHGPGRAAVEVREQRDALLAVPGPLDGVAAQAQQLAQLGGRTGRLDLEVR
jgi:hypothetical protein